MTRTDTDNATFDGLRGLPEEHIIRFLRPVRWLTEYRGMTRWEMLASLEEQARHDLTIVNAVRFALDRVGKPSFTKADDEAMNVTESVIVKARETWGPYFGRDWEWLDRHSGREGDGGATEWYQISATTLARRRWLHLSECEESERANRPQQYAREARRDYESPSALRNARGNIAGAINGRTKQGARRRAEDEEEARTKARWLGLIRS